VQIHSSVRDEDVFIIQSPSPPAINDHLMELLIMISGE
jgi:ribose-phosphate pyrophosphokinase